MAKPNTVTLGWAEPFSRRRNKARLLQRLTHDYKRHGTTTLFAALDILGGTVIGHNMKRHRHQEFIRFLNTIEVQVPKRKAITPSSIQVCHPQTSQGARMACPASPLNLPLLPDLLEKVAFITWPSSRNVMDQFKLLKASASSGSFCASPYWPNGAACAAVSCADPVSTQVHIRSCNRHRQSQSGHLAVGVD
jgi:hypothetical protein